MNSKCAACGGDAGFESTAPFAAPVCETCLHAIGAQQPGVGRIDVVEAKIKPWLEVRPGQGRPIFTPANDADYLAGYAAGVQAERARILALIDHHLQHEWSGTVQPLKEAVRDEAPARAPQDATETGQGGTNAAELVP